MGKVKVKTPREAPGMYNLKGIPPSQRDVASKIVPFRSPRNLRHCHYLNGIRDINRIEWKDWESRISNMLRRVEKQRLGYANQFYHALERVQGLVEEGRQREEKLQATTEELDANYEELQASNEEMESTNEELQATTEELERTSAYRQSLMDSMMDILMTTDPSGVITEVNRATEHISGCSKDQLIGQPLRTFFTDPDRAQAGIEKVLAEGGVSNYELAVATKDGREIPVGYNATVLRDPDGRITGVLGSARDMTELKEAEKELQTAVVYNRSLIDASIDPMVTVDPSGKINDCNSATEKATGCSREELMGTDFSNYFSNPEMARAGFEEAFQEGQVRDYLLELKHKDGRLTPVLYNASVFRDEAGEVKGLFVAARDISKWKETEDELRKTIDNLKNSQNQLIQASKMSAVGTMTAGIAHELNNPMMGIINFIQYVLKHTDKDDKRYTVLEDAEREVRRASSIVQNLLSFSHMEEKGAEESQKEGCDVVIDRVIDLLAYRIESQNVSLHRHTAEGTPEIWMNTNNIQQVFFNLINNALHAVEETEKKEVSVDMRRSGEFVEITVTDSGIGIAPENLEKIFDLFYTTKPAGKGLGLGLSTSYSIIQAHGGEITCESKPGKGTTFKVLLPVERRIQKEEKNE